MHAHHMETSEDRSATILVRLSPEEKEAVEIAAETLRISLSDIARHMLVGLPLPVPPQPRIHAQVHGELGRVGVNLNQCAHALNRLTAFQDLQVAPAVLGDLRRELGELGTLLRRIQVDLAGGGAP